jgi:hypothetical protein
MGRGGRDRKVEKWKEGGRERKALLVPPFRHLCAEAGLLDLDPVSSLTKLNLCHGRVPHGR